MATVAKLVPWMALSAISIGAGYAIFVSGREVKSQSFAPITTFVPKSLPTAVRFVVEGQGVGSYPHRESLEYPFESSASSAAWVAIRAEGPGGVTVSPESIPIESMSVYTPTYAFKARPSIANERIVFEVPRTYLEAPKDAKIEIQYLNSYPLLAPPVKEKLRDFASVDPHSRRAENFLQSVSGQVVVVADNTDRFELRGESIPGHVIVAKLTHPNVSRRAEDGSRLVSAGEGIASLSQWSSPYFVNRFDRKVQKTEVELSCLFAEPIDAVVDLPPVQLTDYFGQPCFDSIRSSWITVSPNFRIRVVKNFLIPKRPPRHTNRIARLPIEVSGPTGNLAMNLECTDDASLPISIQLDGNFQRQSAPILEAAAPNNKIQYGPIRGLKLHITGTAFRTVRTLTRDFPVVYKLNPKLEMFRSFVR